MGIGETILTLVVIAGFVATVGTFFFQRATITLLKDKAVAAQEREALWRDRVHYLVEAVESGDQSYTCKLLDEARAALKKVKPRAPSPNVSAKRRAQRTARTIR